MVRMYNMHKDAFLSLLKQIRVLLSFVCHMFFPCCFSKRTEENDMQFNLV